MKKYNLITKIFLYISFIFAVIWTGSYLLRMFLFYQIFTERNFELKEYAKGIDLLPVFQTLLPAISTTFISYIVFLLFFILFFIFSRIKLRENGWFFIITMIIIITAPFEIYLMTLDAHMISGLFYKSMNSGEILNLVIKRFKVLSSFPIIEILSYLAVFYLAVFQPLTKRIHED